MAFTAKGAGRRTVQDDEAERLAVALSDERLSVGLEHHVGRRTARVGIVLSESDHGELLNEPRIRGRRTSHGDGYLGQRWHAGMQQCSSRAS